MTNYEILEKAILKAENNGWKYNIDDYQDNYYLTDIQKASLFIFSHKFAKAFFGKKKKCICSGFCIQYQGCSCGANISGWRFHLQQMVLETEPLKYLKRFLNEDK